MNKLGKNFHTNKQIENNFFNWKQKLIKKLKLKLKKWFYTWLEINDEKNNSTKSFGRIFWRLGQETSKMGKEQKQNSNQSKEKEKWNDISKIH